MKNRHLIRKPVTWYIILGIFAIPHLIDDFLFDIPADFGMTNQFAQILSSLFILIFLLIMRALVLEKRTGYNGAIFMGIFLALAGFLKHVPLILQPGPYWSGWFSEFLIFGLFFSGIILAISSISVLLTSTKE
jgi:hypothetical protein